MGKRGYIGESKSDKAIDKMDKFIKKSDAQKARDGRKTEKQESIIEQLKRMYPATWKDELIEIVREQEDPDYVRRKKAAKEAFKNEWYDRPAIIREGGPTLADYVTRMLAQWILDNRIKK